ncbi:MAG: AbrB/MazE/SpoVT family DNA-binding domain-containing protein [Chloroflexi bacterium]|nr:AbrB/MazE/SpoVT family DNA-binding domain-containing protein [Chloroflexota bacterium]
MVRKIFKTGNSLVISLPKDSIKQLGLREGSEVSVTVEAEEGRLIVEPMKQQIVEIDPAFAQQVNEFIEQYRPALEALAK